MQPTMRLVTPEEVPLIEDTWHFEGDGTVDDNNRVDPALAPAA